MVKREVAIVNELGMHARAAAKFVREAHRFVCEVWIRKEGERVNGKSIMGILTLAASRGETVVIEAEGEDEADALASLANLVAEGFGEGVKNAVES